MYVHMCLFVCLPVSVYICGLSFTVLFIQGKQGEIKHVYRGSVFIQSCNLVENGGLIVAKARHVELAGGTGVVSSCFFMYIHTLAHEHTHMHTHTHAHTHTRACACSQTYTQSTHTNTHACVRSHVLGTHLF